MVATFLKKYKIEIILLAVSLAAHFFFFFLLLHDYGPDFSYATNEDAAEFFTLGQNLYQHQVFSSALQPPFYLNSFRTILYPLYLTFFQFFSTSALWPIVFQNLIAAFSVLVAYRLGLTVIKNKKIVLLAAYLFALDPLQNYWANIMEPDTVLVFFVLLSLLYFLKFWQSQKYRLLVWSALYLGLAALVKPVAIYYPIFLGLFILADAIFFKKNWRGFFKPAAIFMVIFFLTLSPWLLRNYYHFKNLSLASITGVNLYRFAGEVGPYPAYITDYLQEVKEKYGQNGQNANGSRDVRAQKELALLSIKRIMEQPLVYAKAHIMGMVKFYLNDGHEEAYYNKHFKALLVYDTPMPQLGFSISEEVKQGHLAVFLKVLRNINQYLAVFILSKIIYVLGYLILFFGWFKSYRLDKKLFLVFSLFLALSFYIALAAGPWGMVVRYRLPVLFGLFLIFSYGFWEMVDAILSFQRNNQNKNLSEL